MDGLLINILGKISFKRFQKVAGLVKSLLCPDTGFCSGEHYDEIVWKSTPKQHPASTTQLLLITIKLTKYQRWIFLPAGDSNTWLLHELSLHYRLTTLFPLLTPVLTCNQSECFLVFICLGVSTAKLLPDCDRCQCPKLRVFSLWPCYMGVAMERKKSLPTLQMISSKRGQSSMCKPLLVYVCHTFMQVTNKSFST